MIHKTNTNGFFKYLGRFYFLLAFFSVYFTTDLYWWPEQGIEYDWAPFPTGLMLLTPSFIIWGITCLTVHRFERDTFPFHEPRKRDRIMKNTIPFLTFFLLILISVASSHILSTMRFHDEVIQNPIFFGFLVLNFACNFLSSLVLFFLDRFSRVIMDRTNLRVLFQISLIFFPLCQVFLIFFSVSFTLTQYQILGFGNGNIIGLPLFSSTVLPIILGVNGFILAFTDLFPLFSPFLFLCTCLLLLELFMSGFYPRD